MIYKCTYLAYLLVTIIGKSRVPTVDDVEVDEDGDDCCEERCSHQGNIR